MGIGYEHFVKNRFFNKYDTSLAVSGDSVLPFIGDRNLYSIIQPSVHVFRSQLSNPNASGFVPNPLYAHGFNSGNYPLGAGPINAVYEIEISGVTNYNGGASQGPTCSGYNEKFYVFFDSPDTVYDANSEVSLYEFQGTTDEVQGGGQSDIYEYSWYGIPCNNSRKYKIHDKVDRIIFSTIINNRNHTNLPIQSGHVGFGVTFYGTATNSFEITYALDTGPIGSGRKWMLEEDLTLYPVESSIHLKAGTTIGSRFCSHYNSVCTVRPVRDGIFDIRNTNLFFNSKLTHYPNIYITSTNPNFPPSVVNILFNSGYHVHPGAYEIWFSGVTNKIENSSCIPCSEYFSQKFQFVDRHRPFSTSLGVPIPRQNTWFWNPVGIKRDIEPTVSTQRRRPFVNGYLNICDYGCGDTDNVLNLANNYCLEPMWLWLDNSGLLKLFIDSAISPDEGPIPDSGTFSYDKSTMAFSKMIPSGVTSDLFDEDTYNEPWKFHVFGQNSRVFPIFNLCEFASAIPIIRPLSTSGILRCNDAGACLPLCYDFRHPQTVIVSMTLPDGTNVNRALTLNHALAPTTLNTWTHDSHGSPSIPGNRRTTFGIDVCDFTGGDTDNVHFSYHAPEDHHIVNGSISGEFVNASYSRTPFSFNDREAIDCNQTIIMSGCISNQAAPFACLAPQNHFIINATLTDFV